MKFEEWWEEERVGMSREEELNRVLYIDFWRVNRIIREAFIAGYRAGKMENDH